MTYTIESAGPGHIHALNGIELAAATLFPPGSIPEHVLSDRLPREVLDSAMRSGMLWVALDAVGAPVGYALLQLVDGYALLAQMDVHPLHGRRGLGTALVRRAAGRVRELNLDELYLTTFSHVPWNAPFYARLGFRVVPAAEQPLFIKDILHAERVRGLADRVAMRLAVAEASFIRRVRT